jgi:pyruvate dehydrogenase E2 component (dihydrolipoamide acetyltransferase)
MRYEFHLPDIGEGLTEAVIASWSVKAGDAIKEDAPLCEIETDKALVEITSPCTGTILSVTGAPGETLKVGTVLAVFETDKLPAGASRSPHNAVSETPNPDAFKGGTAVSETGPVSTEASIQQGIGIMPFAPSVRATPATRRFAREQGVDLNAIAGSGPGGRILQSDIIQQAGNSSALRTSGAFAAVDQRFAIAPIPHEPGQTRVALAGLRKTVADQMVRSVTIIPHAASAFRCEASRFVALRKTLQERLGVRISFTAMVMKAMVPALQMFPTFNCSFDDTTNEIVYPPSINIGFATRTDAGLIVPVVKNCESKSLVEIAADIDRLAESARTRKIALADLRGGTITLSNVGSHGRVEITGGRLIINHPQAAIVGISKIKPCPVVRDGQVVVAQCLDINTSYDHRIIDGIDANLFMERLVDIIEEPGMMLAV